MVYFCCFCGVFFLFVLFCFLRFPISVLFSYFYLSWSIFIPLLEISPWCTVMFWKDPGGLILRVHRDKTALSSFIPNKHPPIMGCSKISPSFSCHFKISLTCILISICWLFWGFFLLFSGLADTPLLSTIFSHTDGNTCLYSVG